jgi:hypothetical protein
MHLLPDATRRRAARARLSADRLARLAEVPVCAAGRAEGRIVTVAVRPPASSEASERPDALRAYLNPWWSTLQRLGLPATILASGWSGIQQRTVETPLIHCEPVRPGRRHIFHERHFLVRDYLRRIDDPMVFVTDGADVAFKSDPFEFVRAAGDSRRLFIGREKHRILFCRCVRRELLRQFGRVPFPLRPVLNPGILGGRREIVLEALDRICETIESLGERLAGSDMGIVNRAVHSAFAPRELECGLPLHSRFKGWEFDAPAAILHK